MRGAEDLPSVMKFSNLHLTESLKEAKEILQAQPVYCMLCQETGTMSDIHVALAT